LRGAFDLFMSDGNYLWLRSGQGLSQIKISLAEHAHFFVREGGFMDGLRLLMPTGTNEYLVSFNEPDGLYLFNRGKFVKLSDLPQNKAIASTLSKESILFVTNYTEGKLLLLAWEGSTFLYEIKTQTISPLRIGCIADFRRSYVKNLFTDSSGNIWIGSYDGSLMRFNPHTGQCHTFSREQWPGLNSTFRFYEDSRRRIWVGMEYGIAIYDPLKECWRVLPRTERIQSGVYQEVSAFCEDGSQRLWIGSYLQGMAYVQMQDVDRLMDTAPDDAFFWENLQFRQPALGTGINSTNIKNLMVYNDTTMLIRTQLGISMFNTIKHTATNFGVGYGVYPMFNQFNDRLLESGYYTVALPNGFGFIDISALIREPQPVKIPIRITSFRVMEEERINIQNINFDTLVQLRHYENFMALEFELLDYAAGINKRFWYKMEGVQDDWVEIKGGTLAFNNLDAGSYTLHLKAEADHSHTLVAPYRLHLKVAQAWWRSWWFRLAVLLAVVVLVYFMIRFYLREQELNTQLVKLEMKSLRSQMNPHFLFNSLNSINNYILKNEPDKASDYLQRFSVLIRRILNNSQYELISLSEELNTLKSYVEMEQLRFKSKFSYAISVDQELDTDEIRIPPMLVQPYVENAIWHGILHKESAGYLEILLKAEAEQCYIIVTDNGVGRARAAALKSKSALKEKSLGMSITQNRIDIINQYYRRNFAVKVEDLHQPNGEAAGTRVTISFKCS
jgi:two-component sensor histidine kinase